MAHGGYRPLFAISPTYHDDKAVNQILELYPVVVVVNTVLGFTSHDYSFRIHWLLGGSGKPRIG